MANRNSAFYYRDNSDSYEQDEHSGNSGKKQISPDRRSQIAMKHNEAKSGSLMTIILVSVVAAALLGSVIYSFDRRNTAYNKVAALNNELNLMEAENVRLQSELESRMSAKNVEDYAENVLGMQKIDSEQIEYIKIQTYDVVNIPQKSQSIGNKIKSFFEKCVEYFRG